VDVAIRSDLIDRLQQALAEGTFLIIQVVRARQLIVGPRIASVWLAKPHFDASQQIGSDLHESTAPADQHVFAWRRCWTDVPVAQEADLVWRVVRYARW